MCGIAGAVGAVDPPSEEAVRAMAEAEAHRGPDDSGFFRSEGTPGAALGFRRLAIMDLSMDGHQPMIDPRERNTVVFNGEIYNYGQLRKELAARGLRVPLAGRHRGLAQGVRALGRRTPSPACAACSPSRSTTPAAVKSCSRAIDWGSSRSITRPSSDRAVRSCSSPPSCARCWRPGSCRASSTPAPWRRSCGTASSSGPGQPPPVSRCSVPAR